MSNGLTLENTSARAISYVKSMAKLSLRLAHNLGHLDRLSGDLTTPSDRWTRTSLNPVESGLKEVFLHICGIYDQIQWDADVVKGGDDLYTLISQVIVGGEWLASSACESEEFRRIFADHSHLQIDANHAIELRDFGLDFNPGGRGREFRMEMLAAGWLTLYFTGCRSDALGAGLMRLASIQSELPYGLSYWCGFGWVLDQERFSAGERMIVRDFDVYSIRDNSIILSGKPKKFSIFGGVMALAQLYAEVQVALVLRAQQQMRADEFSARFVLIVSVPSDPNVDAGPFWKRLSAWQQAGLEVYRAEPAEIAELGPSLLGNVNGLGYFAAPKNPKHDEDQTAYGCFRIQGPPLHYRKEKIRVWLAKNKDHKLLLGGMTPVS